MSMLTIHLFSCQGTDAVVVQAAIRHQHPVEELGLSKIELGLPSEQRQRLQQRVVPALPPPALKPPRRLQQRLVLAPPPPAPKPRQLLHQHLRLAQRGRRRQHRQWLQQLVLQDLRRLQRRFPCHKSQRLAQLFTPGSASALEPPTAADDNLQRAETARSGGAAKRSNDTPEDGLRTTSKARPSSRDPIPPWQQQRSTRPPDTCARGSLDPPPPRRPRLIADTDSPLSPPPRRTHTRDVHDVFDQHE